MAVQTNSKLVSKLNRNKRILIFKVCNFRFKTIQTSIYTFVTYYLNLMRLHRFSLEILKKIIKPQLKKLSK